MAITNRELPAETRLVAKHKGMRYVAIVSIDEAGKRLYELEAPRPAGADQFFKSPSAAGSAITGGAVNGWVFWTPEGEEKPTKEPKAKAEKAPKAAKTPKAPRAKKEKFAKSGNGYTPIRPAAEEGLWFCDACMATFEYDGEGTPEVCSNGHSAAEIAAEVVEV